ncbi:hypothetical protein ACJMK2_016509, partial [Sinanodonta woodiana]
SLTNGAIANEYKSTDNKKENKTVETSYESLDLEQFSKDQQTYDHLEQEFSSEHCDNKPPSGHQKLTLRNCISANTTPSKTENVYESERDSQDNENVSRQCKPNSQRQKETQTVVEDMGSEVHGANGKTDHVYFVLESADNTREMHCRQSEADHLYFVLETVDKIAEVESG